MSRILAVHASPRGERSQSRRLAEVFLAAYREAHPQARVARREVGRVPLPAVTEAFVAAAFHPQPEQRSLAMQADLALSDQLVGELFDSDLKAWIDQIVRLGVTFDFVLDNGVAQYRPLLRGKRALIVTSRGGHGFGPGGENQAMNHADPWLRTALGFIGIDEVTVVAAEGEESGGRSFEDSCAEAEQRLLALAQSA